MADLIVGVSIGLIAATLIWAISKMLSISFVALLLLVGLLCFVIFGYKKVVN